MFIKKRGKVIKEEGEGTYFFVDKLPHCNYTIWAFFLLSPVVRLLLIVTDRTWFALCNARYITEYFTFPPFIARISSCPGRSPLFFASKGLKKGSSRCVNKVRKPGLVSVLLVRNFEMFGVGEVEGMDEPFAKWIVAKEQL